MDKFTSDFDDLSLAVALTAVAGYVDAVGFLRLGHLFVSFMSGNSTQLAVAISHGTWGDGILAAEVVALFLCGVVLGRLVGRYSGRWRRPIVLIFVAFLLAVAATSSWAFLSVAAMVVAMGIQNAVIHHAAGTKTGLTYVTGTLVTMGENFADAIAGAGPLKSCVAPLCLWLGLMVGAATGTIIFATFKSAALALPAACSLALALRTGLSTS